MNRVYFIEQFDALEDYSDGILVSLTPAVSYALEKKGLPFHILRRNQEDLKIRRDDDTFFLEQVEWAKRFDEFLQSDIPLLKGNEIRAVYHHFSKIKFVMDTLLIYTLEAKNFLDQHRFQTLIYAGAPETDFSSPSIFDLRKNGHQAYLEILKIVCREKGIRFEISSPRNKVFQGVTPQSFWTRTIKPFLKALGLKQGFHFFKYAKWQQAVNAKPTATMPGVLFLDAGSEKIDHVIKVFLNKGLRIYTLIGREIFEYSSAKEKRVASLDRPSPPMDFSKTAKKLSREAWIFEILKTKTLLDISPVLLPYLQHFVQEIVPAMASDYLTLKNFCASYPIETIVAHGSSGKQYTAALNLAKNSEQIKGICFQHSCGPTYWMDWVYGELDYFDVFMTTDSLHDAFFQKMSEEPWISECRVQESPFYLKKIKSETSLNKNSKTILYIPRKQSMRISKFNSYLYPLPWLYEIQKAIVDVFGNYPEIPVIYKHHPSSKWAEESILRYITDKGYSNISVQQGNLKSFFQKAERVLMDYPSTPLFEAAAAGLPVLALYPSVDRMIPEMDSFFGDSLTSFSSSPEAAAAVESFLRSAPEKYLRDIPFSSADALQCLTGRVGVPA